jgi:CRISPR-associated Csx10 family RAMP protein
MTGFYDTAGAGPAGARAPRQIVATHVGIDRVTTTASESIFFTLEAMESASAPDTPDLVGSIEADAWAHETLAELLAENDHTIFLGHARTRGYGKLSLTLSESESADVQSQGPEHERRERWSRGFLSFVNFSRYEGHFRPDRTFAFCLTLPTGAILVDDLLRYAWDPANMVGWLPRLPDIDDQRAILDREPSHVEEGRLWALTSNTRQERIRGWNSAHGLPRQDEWGVERGAVYGYWFEGDGASRAALMLRLDRLQSEGIGLRRNEGFGAISISDEFHRLYHEQEKAVPHDYGASRRESRCHKKPVPIGEG